jgi:hypothetical protein
LEKNLKGGWMKEKINLENLTPEQKEELWKTYGKKIEEEKEEQPKDEQKEKPIRSVFIPLGSGWNANFVLWSTTLQIVKSKKEGDVWSDYDKINLSKRLLIELMTRIPSFVAEIESHEGMKDESG